MSLDRKQKGKYLQAIAKGTGRLEAAQGLGYDFQKVLDTAEADEDFADAIDTLEGAAIDDALFAAASSGNIAAIEHYFRRHRHPETAISPAPERRISGAQAEVRRLAKIVRPLLHPRD